MKAICGNYLTSWVEQDLKEEYIFLFGFTVPQRHCTLFIYIAPSTVQSFTIDEMISPCCPERSMIFWAAESGGAKAAKITGRSVNPYSNLMCAALCVCELMCWSIQRIVQGALKRWGQVRICAQWNPYMRKTSDFME